MESQNTNPSEKLTMWMGPRSSGVVCEIQICRVEIQIPRVENRNTITESGKYKQKYKYGEWKVQIWRVEK